MLSTSRLPGVRIKTSAHTQHHTHDRTLTQGLECYNTVGIGTDPDTKLNRSRELAYSAKQEHSDPHPQPPHTSPYVLRVTVPSQHPG